MRKVAAPVEEEALASDLSSSPNATFKSHVTQGASVWKPLPFPYLQNGHDSTCLRASS